MSTGPTIPLLWRAQLRMTTRHPLLAILHVSAVALAVAVLFATAITRHSSSASLALADQGLAGASTARLLAAGGVRDEHYAELRRRWLSRYPGLQLQPVVEGTVTIAGDRVTMQGIDTTAGPRLLALTPLLAGRDAAVIGAGDARRWRTDGVVAVTTPTGVHRLPVAAVIDGGALTGRVLVDLHTARRLLQRPAASLDRIDVTLPAAAGGSSARAERVRQLKADLRTLPPPAVSWVESDIQHRGQRQLIEAFEFNLEALSALALVVAGLLLASTAQFSFRRREPLLQRLRELGVTPARIWRLTVAEAMLLAAVGSVAGWMLGGLLSLVLLPLTAASIETLYGSSAILRFPPDLWSYCWPAALSAALLTGVQSWQLWRWRQPPPGAGVRRGLAALAALGTVGAFQATSLQAAYATVFGTAATLLLIMPDGLRAMLRLGNALPWQGAPLLRLGWRDAARLPPHLALAAAALCVALAASLAVSLMAGSLQSAVADWLRQQLAADLYVQLPEPGQASDAATEWQRQPGVRQVSISLRHDWPLAGHRATVEGLSADGSSYLPLLRCPAACMQRWHDGALLASEPLARRLALMPGDSVSLATADGERDWAVAGILRDFDPGGGRLVMPLDHYRRADFQPQRASLGLWLGAGADRTALEQQARAAGSAMLDPAELQQSVDELFANTFAITDWLRLVVLVIALLAVSAGLSLQTISHRPQLAVLRALGATPAGLSGWLSVQALATAAGAALWALPLGHALAWLLIHQVNPRAFGWTMALESQPGLTASLLPLALAAAALALPYPCWQLFRPSLRNGAEPVTPGNTAHVN